MCTRTEHLFKWPKEEQCLSDAGCLVFLAISLDVLLRTREMSVPEWRKHRRIEWESQRRQSIDQNEIGSVDVNALWTMNNASETLLRLVVVVDTVEKSRRDSQVRRLSLHLVIDWVNDLYCCSHLNGDGDSTTLTDCNRASESERPSDRPTERSSERKVWQKSNEKVGRRRMHERERERDKGKEQPVRLVCKQRQSEAEIRNSEQYSCVHWTWIFERKRCSQRWSIDSPLHDPSTIWFPAGGCYARHQQVPLLFTRAFELHWSRFFVSDVWTPWVGLPLRMRMPSNAIIGFLRIFSEECIDRFRWWQS